MASYHLVCCIDFYEQQLSEGSQTGTASFQGNFTSITVPGLAVGSIAAGGLFAHTPQWRLLACVVEFHADRSFHEL
jgi:hypothetical protein